jgi:hypothetical protein
MGRALARVTQEKEENVYRALVGKPEGRPLGTPRRR